MKISGTSLVWDVSQEKTSEPYEISPRDFGLDETAADTMKGGTPEENADAFRRILDGEKSALRNVVVMNAAAALIAGDATSDFKEATRLAQESIDSGEAGEKLKKLIKLSQDLE